MIFPRSNGQATTKILVMLSFTNGHRGEQRTAKSIICRFGYEKTPSRIFGKVIAARKFRVNTISFPKCF